MNLHTDGGMKRSRQKIDNIKQKRASLLNKEGVEYGSMSEIEGIVADDPNKIRGDRVERLIYEEAGSQPKLIKAWIQGNALVEIGGEKIGIRLAGGTGGDRGESLAGLAQMFNNPRSYNVLPYKNKYTRDGKIAYTGFFIPAHEFSLNPEFVDSRGVTDSVRFKQWYEEQRQKMEGQALLDYCAEHCFTPDEALLRQGDNIFDSIVISERLTQIRVFKENYKKPEPTVLFWTDQEERKAVRSQFSPNSKLLVVEPPLLDMDGNPYSNLYVAGIDSIDMGKDESAIDSDVSDFCIVIKKRAHGMEPPQYVAMYKDRPRKIREAYENAMKLLVWYNCKAMLEYTKISIQQYFQQYNKKHLFMARPEFAVSTRIRRNQTKQLIGLPATEAVIKHGLELIEMYVEDYWHEIMFDEMLEQLLNYSYEEKRKFDIVAALGINCCPI